MNEMQRVMTLYSDLLCIFVRAGKSQLRAVDDVVLEIVLDDEWRIEINMSGKVHGRHAPYGVTVYRDGVYAGFVVPFRMRFTRKDVEGEFLRYCGSSLMQTIRGQELYDVCSN